LSYASSACASLALAPQPISCDHTHPVGINVKSSKFEAQDEASQRTLFM